jgi:uncharacterized membrane protein
VLQIETAREIARGKLLYRDIHEIVYETHLLPEAQYPPLYLYTLAVLILLLGVETFTFEMAKIFLIIVNFLVAYLMYYLVGIYINKKFALFTFNWFLLNPSTLGVVLGGYHENFMLLFVLLAFIFFIQKHSALSGIMFGLSLLVKPTAGVYMLPLLIYQIKEKDYTSFRIWVYSGLTFMIISSPFLFLAPIEFINTVFLVHSSRLDPSMSLYNYIFTELSPTLFPFLVQIIAFIIIGFYMYENVHFNQSSDIIMLVLPFMTIFLALNRILYPHYIPFIFPFFTWYLISLINSYYQSDDKRKVLRQILITISGLGLVYFGYIWWSVLWAIEGYQTYLINILFPLSAIICILGLLIITSSSLASIYLKNNV